MGCRFAVQPLGRGSRPARKGMIVERFLSNIRAKVLYSGYQKIWRLV